MLIMYTTKLLMSKFHQPMPDCLWVYKGMNTKKVNMLWWETRRFSLRALVSGIPPPPPPFPQDQAHGREFKGHVLIWVSLTVFLEIQSDITYMNTCIIRTSLDITYQSWWFACCIDVQLVLSHLLLAKISGKYFCHGLAVNTHPLQANMDKYILHKWSRLSAGFLLKLDAVCLTAARHVQQKKLLLVCLPMLLLQWLVLWFLLCYKIF